MSCVFHTYGVVAGSLDDARTVLEAHLRIEFEPHNSSFKGDYYRYPPRWYRPAPPAPDEFVLESNFVAEEGEWTLPDRTDLPFLLFVNGEAPGSPVHEVLARVPGVTLLRVSRR